MKKILLTLTVVVITAGLSMPAVAQGKGHGAGRGRSEMNAAEPQTMAPATHSASAPHTHGKSAVHRSTHHHRTATTHTMPARSNKGGAVRGKDRAAEVHSMNQEKRATQKTRTEAPHGKGKQGKR